MRKLLCCVMGILLLILPVVGCKEKTIKRSDMDIDYSYSSFESKIIGSTTNIVRATCDKIDDRDKESRIFHFTILEHYLGETESSKIKVSCFKDEVVRIRRPDGLDCSYGIDAYSFAPGEEYILFLSRLVGVFLDGERIDLVGSIICPISDLSNSTIYNQPLSEHSEIPSYATEEELLGYVNEILSSANPEERPGVGTPPIESRRMKTIVQQSPYVLKVRVDSVYDVEELYGARATCTVLSAMKGEVEEQTTVDIYVQKGEVKEGKTYIVAVHHDGTTQIGTSQIGVYIFRERFKISSKNSVWSTWSEKRIAKYIGE